MALWIPLTLIAVTAAAVYSQRKPSITCAGLSPEDRAKFSRFLSTDPQTILAYSRSAHKWDKGQVVNAIHVDARELDGLGCKEDGDLLRAKANEIAALTESPSPGAGAAAGCAFDLAGAYVAPEVRVGGEANATLHNVAPGTTARLDEAYATAFTPPASQAAPRQSPLVMMRTKARVAIRPDPIPWNDEAMGKLGFTVPAGYPVGVLAVGPPACPVGWTKVELRHPDEGVVEGFTEAANLVPNAPAVAPAAKAAPTTVGRAQPTSFQGRSRTGAKVKTQMRRPSRNPSPRL